jgi:hypothetical protein
MSNFKHSNKYKLKSKRPKKTKKLNNHISKKQKDYKGYPFYRDSYNLDIKKIQIMVNTMNSQMIVYSTKPDYKTYSKEEVKPLHSITNSNQDIQDYYYVIKSSWDDNLELNSLTDYFTESCRIECTFKFSQSPLKYWIKNKQYLLDELKTKQLKLNNYNVRELMYSKGNKPCNNFRISVCLEVLKLFKPKKWLDISAGWGDRLLSALLYTPLEIYCGIDPNPCLHPFYKEMIKTFDPKNSKKCILIKDGFETAQLPDIMFDLVFSSPPFFDLEIYSSDTANSFRKYDQQNSWFNQFLIPSLYKSINYLSPKGFLVLYMAESKNTNYIPKMIKLIDAKMKNIGMLYYTDSMTINSKLREFYCWQKN